jgi:hypothetical protein
MGGRCGAPTAECLAPRRRTGQFAAPGWDALNDRHTDLVKAGVVDPAKVTGSCRRNAPSVAGMVLSTETGMTEIPEKREPPAPRHDVGRRASQWPRLRAEPVFLARRRPDLRRSHPVTEEEIIRFVAALPGVDASTAREGDGSPEVAWGDSFFLVLPPGEEPSDQRWPFATLNTLYRSV